MAWRHDGSFLCTCPVWLLLCAVLPRTTGATCSHRQQMGCILDVLEKTCAGDEGPVALWLERHSVESAWMCCCPKPYGPCSKDERLPACDAAFLEFVEPVIAAPKPSDRSVREALVHVWTHLRDTGSESCAGGNGANASASALQEFNDAICGSEATPPVRRSLADNELFCEMISWQWEELGDGNQREIAENSCQDRLGAKADHGDARKGHRLTTMQLPDSWPGSSPSFADIALRMRAATRAALRFAVHDPKPIMRSAKMRQWQIHPSGLPSVLSNRGVVTSSDVPSWPSSDEIGSSALDRPAAIDGEMVGP